MENPQILKSLMCTIVYFDIFSYPLKAEEIVKYCNVPGLDIDKGIMLLEGLKKEGMLNQKDGFYFLGNDISKIKRRLDGNQLATKRMSVAKRYAALISNFPFVRAIFISGSLSKNFMLSKSDIDFFIITEPGKLWLCRAILVIFKKLFLFNSYRNFCLNYFIDSKSLEIPDKNIYTANEIAFLLPMYNYQLYCQFIGSNSWVRAYYPNIELLPEKYFIKPFTIKRLIENFFNNRLGNTFDNWSFTIFTKFWRRKFSYFDEKTFNFNLRSKKNVSKHHPNDFQSKVLKIYGQRIIELEQLA